MEERGVVFLMTMAVVVLISMIVIPYFLLVDMNQDMINMSSKVTYQEARIEKLEKEVRLLKQDNAVLTQRIEGTYGE